MTLEVIKNAKKWVGLSVILVIISLGILLFKGFNYGIDFTGGNLYQLKFNNPIQLTTVNSYLDGLSKEFPQLHPRSRKVQISEGNNVIIRTQEMNENEQNAFLKDLNGLGQYQIEKTDKVGASIGEELKSSALLALGIGGVLIVLYITLRFEFKFAIAAIISLFHDLIIAVAVISLLGYEINSPFIAAVLTILGYSINDTIVVFDRIRESLKKKSDYTFGEILNRSMNQVMMRSINTSLTTLFAVIAILVFGGDSLRTFITTLLFGILAGTYSSIFLATPLVYFFEKKRDEIYEPKHDHHHDDSNNEDKILV
ncbi:protein translocase subunit SecF [Cetobacterium sp. SF1]|uniref:protein translocase subunit SecF n=1 Tax=unclassified Cetobacterium TaxID=2630983 RepID=UPI003CF24F2F